MANFLELSHLLRPELSKAKVRGTRAPPEAAFSVKDASNSVQIDGYLRGIRIKKKEEIISPKSSAAFGVDSYFLLHIRRAQQKRGASEGVVRSSQVVYGYLFKLDGLALRSWISQKKKINTFKKKQCRIRKKMWSGIKDLQPFPLHCVTAGAPFQPGTCRGLLARCPPCFPSQKQGRAGCGSRPFKTDQDY